MKNELHQTNIEINPEAGGGSGERKDAVEKVVGLMECLAASERVLSVRELGALTGISRSTAQRFLAALVQCGWAAQNSESGAYRAGMRFFLQSGNAGAKQRALVRSAAPAMRRLMERTGKTAILSVPDGDHGVCIHTEEPESAVKFVARQGTIVPLVAGATGLVLLAFGDAAMRERFLAQPHELPGGQPANANDLRGRIEQIRRDGCAHSREEWMPHAEDVSVPVFDPRGSFLAQLGVAGLAGTFGGWENDVLPLLRQAAEEITGNM